MPILSTKFFLPPLAASAIRRDRLVNALLAEWRNGREIMILQGPAGYGKTTTLIQFAHQVMGEGATLIWASLNADDNRADQFCESLYTACESLKGISLPSRSQLESIGPMQSVDEILSALLAANEQVICICLDDLHVLSNEGALKVLDRLIQSAGGRITLCLGSRECLPVNRGRLKTYNKLFELGVNDLRFDLDESKVLLGKLSTLSLSEPEIQQLYSKTDGWPALLVLALLEADKKLDPTAWVMKFSGRQEDIANFLTEEVFEDIPDGIVECLLKISVVDRFSAPLCQSLTGVEQLPEKLASYSSINLLMQRLDEQGRWLKIHPILRDFLRQKMEARYSVEQQRELYHCASLWCEENGLTYMAVKFALDAGEQDRAVIMFREYGIGLAVENHFPSFLRLIGRLPADVLIENPELLFEQAWPLMVMYETYRCNQVLDELQSLYSKSRPMPDVVQAELTAVKVCQHLFTEQTAELISKAPALLQAPVFEGYEHIKSSVRIAYAISLYRDNYFLEALSQSAECIPLRITPGLLYSAVLAWCLRVIIALTQGQVAIARSEVNQLRQFTEDTVEADSMVHALVQPLDAVVSYVSGDSSRALQLLGQHSVVESRVADPLLMCWAVPVQARILEEMGKREQAFVILRAAWHFAEEKQLPGLVACVGSELLRLYSRSGEIAMARLLMPKIRQYFNFGKTSLDAVSRGFFSCAEARFAMVERDTTRAAVKLKALHDECLASNRLLQALDCQLELAECYLMEGKEERCYAALRKAMDMDVAQELPQLFRSTSKEFLLYLMKVGKNNPSPRQQAFISSLLQGLELDGSDQDVLPLAEPLTNGEGRVLACLVQGMRNQAIAEELELSINTIKAYLKSAYGKLGVSSRTQAVARLNELNLSF